MTRGVPGTFVTPPITPAAKPTGTSNHRALPGGTRGDHRVTLRSTNTTTVAPSRSVAVRAGSTASRRVPTTVPTAPNSVRSGVPSVGKPKPIAPLTTAARRTTTALASAAVNPSIVSDAGTRTAP